MTTTCQICGRDIKSKNGFIAHHGYKRPGSGWQTASCFGAKYRPYEVASDALPKAIARLEQQIANNFAMWVSFISEPPATLKKVSKRMGYDWDTKEYPRPENWTPPKGAWSSMGYENAWCTVQSQREHDNRGMCDMLEFLRKRLAEWKAPE